MRNYSYTKRALLRELSENSRVSVTALAKRLRCSRNTVMRNINALEKEFDLKYTLEFNKDISIVQNQVWCVKLGVKPKTKDLKEIFKDDSIIQFAARTEGDFDLIINLVADSSESYIRMAMGIMNKLLPYKSTFEQSHILLIHTGLMSLGEKAIEKLSLANSSIDELDKRILILMNENSRLSYQEMGDALHENVATIRYRLGVLTKMNLIKRFTVILRKPPTEYNTAFFMKCSFTTGIKNRYAKASEYYIDSDEKLPIVNKFQYLALTSGSYILFGIGCFESMESAFKDTVIAHKGLYKYDSPVVYSAKITEVVKGELPIRNIELKKEYRQIAWE
jgi:DNA-binding Lrp family transcriptional regulator